MAWKVLLIAFYVRRVRFDYNVARQIIIFSLHKQIKMVAYS